MDLTYTSTRGHGEKVTASQAILKGLADDGGLFVPTSCQNWMFRWKNWPR